MVSSTIAAMGLPISPASVAAIGQGFRSVLARAGKVGTPASGGVSVMTDLGSPVGSFTLLLTCFFGGISLVSGLMWFGRHRKKLAAAMADGKISGEELRDLVARNAWSVTFAFSLVATLVFGTVLALQRLSGSQDSGILAKLIPAVERMQASLFNLEKGVGQIQDDTRQLRQDTGDIKKSLQQMTDSFAALSSGKSGLIADPKSPEQWYHNARYCEEVSGDRRGARKAYLEFFNEKMEVFDPWQRFLQILKAEEGPGGARESLAEITRNNSTLSAQLAKLLLQEGEARTKGLVEFAGNHPEFGPALYHASREFSAERLGNQSLADKRMEKQWVEKFLAAQAAGHFYRYYLDKRLADSAVSDAEARLAQANSMAAALETPVRLMHMQSNQGWMVTLMLADYDAKELFTRMDDDPEFHSTGFQGAPNPRTGLPMPSLSLNLGKIKAGPHVLHVQYKDTKDRMNGPYALPFETTAAMLASVKPILKTLEQSWVQFSGGNTFFTSLLSYRQALKEIRYSFDAETPAQQLDFTPWEGTSVPDFGDYTKPMFIPKPAGAKFITLQITYRDGEKSNIVKIPVP